MKKSFSITCLIFMSVQLCAQNQKATVSPVVISFWNVENLYDTIDDPLKDDDEFTPGGKLAWTSERYHRKIEHLGKVIADISSEFPNGTLGLMGLCEIENISVLNDLVKSPATKSLHLTPLLIEGPDARGVDVALLYHPGFFQVKQSVSYSVVLPVDTSHKTRGILVVSGTSYSQALCVIVNHWPSRRGGESVSRPNRIAAAKKVREIYDSIIAQAPETKILIMGDFNDDPVDISLKKVLVTVGEQQAQNSSVLFNPFEKLFSSGSGTLAWRDNWNLFDQILLNTEWKKKESALAFAGCRIFYKKYLASDYGPYKNYPFRTFSGGAYTGGYSDHFPVILHLKHPVVAD